MEFQSYILFLKSNRHGSDTQWEANDTLYASLKGAKTRYSQLKRLAEGRKAIVGINNEGYNELHRKVNGDWTKIVAPNYLERTLEDLLHFSEYYGV